MTTATTTVNGREASSRSYTWVWVALIVAAVVVAFVALLVSNPKWFEGIAPNGGNNAAAAGSEADTAAEEKQQDLQVVIDEALQGQGFTTDEYTYDVDASADLSVTGPARYSDTPIHTPADAVGFMGSGTPQAEAAVQMAIESTSRGAWTDSNGKQQPAVTTTRSELLDASNWVAVQFKGTKVEWGGNTYWLAGTTHRPSTARIDDSGTIAVIFVPPQQVAQHKVTSLFVLRGVCGNPQYTLPRPVRKPEIPVTPPEEYCIKPPKPGEGPYDYNPETCVWTKGSLTFDQQQNEGPWVQNPQDNDLVEESGVNTGATPGAGTAPVANPVLPAPAPGQPAPAPVDGGYNSGGGAGSAPGGTTTDGSGTTTGDSAGTSDPDSDGDVSETNNGTDGTNSTGGGTITNPFG